jgi:hypothetical protein
MFRLISRLSGAMCAVSHLLQLNIFFSENVFIYLSHTLSNLRLSYVASRNVLSVKRVCPKAFDLVSTSNAVKASFPLHLYIVIRHRMLGCALTVILDCKTYAGLCTYP